jgi:hypothetical protein
MSHLEFENRGAISITPGEIMKIFTNTLKVLVFVICSAFLAGAQEITGLVTDPSGAVVANATITATHRETGTVRTTQSGHSGLYTFSGLEIGTYDLKATFTGFKTFSQPGLTLNDVISLTTLGTGVSTTNPSFNGVTAQGSSFNLSFNGMRPDHNNWLIDGGEVYDRGSGGKLDVMPAPDVIAEFQILGSNYSPDYGIASGGTVTMVLKSGTHDFHGALWEFNRNDAYDANNYFF